MKPDRSAPLATVALLALAVAVAVLDHRRAVGVEAWLPVGIAGLAGGVGRRQRGLLALAAAVALGLASPRRLPGPAGRDVVVVTLDTFRGDHAGIGLTPRLDALAAEGASFTQAFSPIPLTGPAHATMWTGLSPWTHGLSRNGARLEEAVETAAQRAQAQGWRTAAFVGSRVLDDSTGLDRGFDVYDDRFGLDQRVGGALGATGFGRAGAERAGAEVVDRAIRWWSGTRGPRLLWVHLYDAHLPYAPDRPPDPATLAAARAEDRSQERGIGDLEGRHAAEGRLLYAAEITQVDALLGRVLDAVGPDAVVIVLGDHGEALGEHGYWFNHGAMLHDPALHVPLVVRWPGVPVGPDDRLVGVDVVAGLVDAAVAGRPITLPMTPAIEAWTPGQQNRRGLMPGAGPVAATRTRADKVVVDVIGARRFDLVADPDELAPIGLPDADRRVVPLAARRDPAVAAPDDDERARLEALGYVSP